MDTTGQAGVDCGVKADLVAHMDKEGAARTEAADQGEGLVERLVRVVGRETTT